MRAAARKWALALLSRDDRVLRAGYFGSYATRREGVGSDLDLLVVLKDCDLPFERRGLLIALDGLPVPADLLVYTEAELRAILERGDRFARELRDGAIWFTRDGLAPS